MTTFSTRFRRGLAGAVPALLLAGACGGDAGSTASGGAPVPLAEVPARYASAICDLYARCLGPTFVRLFFGSEDCVTLTEQRLESTDFPKIAHAVDSGVVTYDGTLVGPCIESLAQRGCDFERRSNPTCDGVFKGSVAAGGECELDENCEGDQICNFEGACPGTCGPRNEAGVTCSRDGECADDLVCHTTTGLCVVPAGEGEPCEGGVEPQCKTGLWCNGQSPNMPGSCMPLTEVLAAGDGEPCNVITATQELCSEGLVCAVEGVAEQMAVFTCKPANAESGGPCSLAFPEDCPAGEYCPLTEADLAAGTFEAECAPLPRAGEPCLPQGRVGQRCAAFARCGADGLCAAMRDNGETSESNGFCYSGFCVDGGCMPSAFCD